MITMAMIEGWLALSGWTIERAPLPGSRTAAIDPARRVITVEADTSDDIALLSALHEGAHLVLGHDLTERAAVNEAEAERMALDVALRLGTDLGRASEGYLTGLPGSRRNTWHLMGLARCWADDLRAHA